MLAKIEELKQKVNFRSPKREIQTQWEILQITRTPLVQNNPESKGDLYSGDAYEEIDPGDLLQGNRPPTQQHMTAHSGLEPHQQDEEQMVLSPALKIKYPQIKLPHFDGENDSWDEFWDVYSLIVDQNAQLGELEKILYLKDAIRGKAQNAIKSIPMKASNYSLIVDVLHKKYGNKGNNRSQIVQRLLALPAANTGGEKCVETLEKVNDLVFQMVATGYDVRKRHDPLWVDTILAKFPYEIIKECMKREKEGSQLTVGVLLEELGEEVSSTALFERRFKSLRGKNLTIPTLHDARNRLRQTACFACFAADPGLIDQKIVSFFSLLLKKQKPSLLKLVAVANPTVLWWIKTNHLQHTNMRKTR
ncbi:unnamed protein product [Heligmosomoides polygyrus]|uniref:Uncharacterized protein n=1 Tax=Heligmosomoides polygyrus TaxID=6339 RepID=A0A183FN33_HELPZ|nr:unnamed protein product [Heligmosomoides polygyrus]